MPLVWISSRPDFVDAPGGRRKRIRLPELPSASTRPRMLRMFEFVNCTITPGSIVSVTFDATATELVRMYGLPARFQVVSELMAPPTSVARREREQHSRMKR